MEVANTLAYYETATTTAVKKVLYYRFLGRPYTRLNTVLVTKEKFYNTDTWRTMARLASGIDDPSPASPLWADPLNCSGKGMNSGSTFFFDLVIAFTIHIWSCITTVQLPPSVHMGPID